MNAYLMSPGSRLALAVLLAGAVAACGGGEERTRGEDAAVPAAAQAPAPGVGPDLETPGGSGASAPGAKRGVTDGSAQPERAAVESARLASRTEGSEADAGSSTAPVTGPDRSGTDRPAASSGQGAQQASPSDILRATARAYNGLRSFRAGFEQTLHNTLLGRTTRSQGTLYQRQPDRFLMAFSQPSDDVIVSDGEYFWMYFPSVDRKQVLRTPRGSQGLDLHAQFIGDPVQRFETTYHGREAVGGRMAHVMTLIPRERMGYSRLKVWIDEADHLVRRFELTEANENVRHFILSDMVKNPSLPDSLFAFTPPPGTQVVDR